MKVFLSAIDAVSAWSGKIFSFLTVVVVGVITFEVIMRYVFHAPTRWGHETMTYLSGILYMMGGAYTLYLQRHARVDVVYERFSPRIRAIMDLVTFPAFFLFCGVLLWVGAEYFWASAVIRETTPSGWAPPIYPIKLFIPLGGFLILLQGLAKFIRDFNIATKGRELS